MNKANQTKQILRGTRWHDSSTAMPPCTS